MVDKEVEAAAAALEDYSNENLDEVVLTSVARPDGGSVRVVYRNGGPVDAVALEVLCDKVRAGWGCSQRGLGVQPGAHSAVSDSMCLEPGSGALPCA